MMQKIEFSSNRLIPLKKSIYVNNNSTTLFQYSQKFKSDIFVKQNVAFGKKEKLDSQTEKPFIEKLKDLYRKKGFKEIGSLSKIFSNVETKEENQFLKDYIENNQLHFTHKVLENITSEFKEFRKKNNRSMNQDELNVFKDFLIGLEYRTKTKEMYYGGNIIHELILLAKTPEDKNDIMQLLENKFELYDGFLLSDNEKKSFRGQAIGRLLEYKKQNPEIADLIIPYAVRYSEDKQTYSNVKDFFEYYKKEGKPAELLEISKNPKLKLSEIKIFYENYMKKASSLSDVIKKNLCKQTYSFFKLAETALREYPELADDLCETLKYSQKIDMYDISLCKKEDKTLFEILSPIQRLRSRKNFYHDDWPVKNKFLIDYTAKKIESGVSFNALLDSIADNYSLIFPEGESQHRGEKRISKYSVTPYSQKNYCEYKSRFDKLISKLMFPPYEDICMSQFVKTGEYDGKIIHPHVDFVTNFLKHVNNNYNSLMPLLEKKIQGHTFTENELKKIDDNIAEIQYLLSVAQPYRRGTAGIINVFIRSLYKSLGVSLPPTKPDISLDLEAFCTPLDEYKQNWKTFFEK